MKTTLLTILLLSASSAEKESSVEHPDIFARRGEVKHCEENGVVAAWCDSYISPELECGILPEFDEYGCTCMGKAASCPSECIGGTEPLVKTHYGIRCGKLPNDTPNYILKERHPLQRCEDNSVVAGWCDDYVNKHLECGLFPEDDQYICKCSGKHTNCPDEW